MSRYWSVLKNQESTAFVFRVDTSIVSGGSTDDDQYKLPLGVDSYDFKVNWGDGTEDNITAYNQAETLHTYPSDGEYTITITGLISNFNQEANGADGRDRSKIIEVLSFGDVYCPNGYMFYNCINCDFSNVSDVFKNISSASFNNSFYGLGNTSIRNINMWDTFPSTSMRGAFGAGFFNEDISNWDVSNVLDMSLMFYYAVSFNQDISNWDFNINVQLLLFMEGKDPSNYNYQYYDNLLIKLESIMVGSVRTETKQLDMGLIKYSSAGLSARNALVADGWAITDGGSI